MVEEKPPSPMESLKSLVERAQSGSLEAFGEIVRRFQGSARRSARSVLADEDLAEDAVQEAFVNAYRDLAKLREPEAFPGWFRRIVLNHSRRLVRGKQLVTVPLESAMELPSPDPGPGEAAHQRELQERVLDAIRGLPEIEREVTRLFYLEGCSQSDIADLMGLPVTTVNNRLHSSRRRLRETPELAVYSPIERMSRTKAGRGWLPSNLTRMERKMSLAYEKTRRKLLRGDVEVTIRMMTREDIPAMRRFDDELTGTMEAHNLTVPPGRENNPGGPWSNDQWLVEHCEQYWNSGNIILLAEDDSGRIVGFADLWAGHEPEPFGASLDVECIDYFVDHYGMGLETILLEEAEKVARAAGIPALDIGTNTSSGDYPSLRQFGLKVLYEFDWVRCRCKPIPADWKPTHRMLRLPDPDVSGLLRVAHWCPTDFYAFIDPVERSWVAEFDVMGHRCVLELAGPLRSESVDSTVELRMPVPEYPPESADLFVAPDALKSPEAMSAILRECAFFAGSLGAEEINLPCPSEIELDASLVDVVTREFGFAWMRKRV